MAYIEESNKTLLWLTTAHMLRFQYDVLQGNGFHKNNNNNNNNNVLPFVRPECAFREHVNPEHKSHSASVASNSVKI